MVSSSTAPECFFASQINRDSGPSLTVRGQIFGVKHVSRLFFGRPSLRASIGDSRLNVAVDFLFCTFLLSFIREQCLTLIGRCPGPPLLRLEHFIRSCPIMHLSLFVPSRDGKAGGGRRTGRPRRPQWLLCLGPTWFYRPRPPVLTHVGPPRSDMSVG